MRTSKLNIEIEIANEQTALEVDEEQIRATVRAALELGHVTRAEITVALVDDATIHDVNRQFLNHDYPTDVISFPLSDSPEALIGDIVLSTDTARREAARVDGVWTPTDEVLLYVAHGMLHLVGFDDHADDDLARMRDAEVAVLRKVGVQPPNTLHDHDGEENDEEEDTP